MKPVIVQAADQRGAGEGPITARGKTLVVQEWQGSGPTYLHVHHGDDEAWHVLDGTVRFRFESEQVDAGAGTTVFVPAGVAHTYEALGQSRYLIILTPRLLDLIEELHRTPLRGHPEVMRMYQSEVLEEV